MLSLALIHDFSHRKSTVWSLQWLLACLLFMLINVPSLAQTQTRVPLLFGENKNEKGEFVPMPERFTKIFQFIEKDLHIKFDLQMYPWNRAVKIASTEGGLIFGLSITAEREQIFTFSEPAVYNYLWLVTRTDKKFEYSKLLDLRGKTIGVVRGSKYGGEFDTQKNTLFKVDDDIDAYGPRLQKVLTHRVDAMIIASPFTDAIDVERQVNAIKIDEKDNSGIQPRFSVLPKPVLKDGIRFAQLKGQNERLIQQISISLNKYYAAESKIQNAKLPKK